MNDIYSWPWYPNLVDTCHSVGIACLHLYHSFQAFLPLRVATAQGKQGIWIFIFPDMENREFAKNINLRIWFYTAVSQGI